MLSVPGLFPRTTVTSLPFLHINHSPGYHERERAVFDWMVSLVPHHRPLMQLLTFLDLSVARPAMSANILLQMLKPVNIT